MKYSKFAPIIIVSACLFFLCGCGKDSFKDETVLAVVNGELIYLKDLNRIISVKLKRNPMFVVTPQSIEDHIDILIDNKIMIQEARKEGLDKREHFLNTIKTFWEQTLVRDLIEHKTSEIKKGISFSEKDTMNYYNNLKHEKTFRAIKSIEKIKITDAVKKDPNDINWEETLGPIRYNEISSDFLREVFNLKEGETGIFKDGSVYYLFYCSNDKILTLSPFEDMKEAVKTDMIEKDKNKVFKEWVRKAKAAADVRVNSDAVKGTKYNE